MSKQIKLSIAIATFNEENNLFNCLKSVENIADEIIVVDGKSTDKTVEIANKFKAQVIITENIPIFHINKQLAVDKCTGNWILQLDADEIIPIELSEEITKIIHNDSSDDAYYIKRKKMFLGKWIKKGGQFPDPVIRLFKKEKAHLPCKSVHEQFEVNGKVGWLENPMLHFTTPNFETYITKDNRYSSLTADTFKQGQVKINFFNFFNYLIFKPMEVFITIYIVHGGFKDGFPGFVFAYYSGLHLFTAYVKYWELLGK